MLLGVEDVVSVTHASEAVWPERLNRAETFTLSKRTVLVAPTCLYLFTSIPSHNCPRTNVQLPKLLVAKKGNAVNCENVFSEKNYNYGALEQQQ